MTSFCYDQFLCFLIDILLWLSTYLEDLRSALKGSLKCGDKFLMMINCNCIDYLSA